MADEEVQETQEVTQDVSRETTVDEYSVPDRPEWLPEKFKTEKDLVESYHNLEKKMGQKEEDLKRSWEEELNKVGSFKVSINLHAEVKASISIEIDKTQSK